MVRASDVPRIVKAEVERALREELRLDDPTAYTDPWGKKMAWIRVNAYLSSRFPEAAPEPKMGETLHTCTMGPDCPNHVTHITPSAPAELCPHGGPRLRCLLCAHAAPPSAAPAQCPADGTCDCQGMCKAGLPNSAAARPEATECTACGCAACADQRAFVKALAAYPPPYTQAPAVLAAARKVVTP